MSDYFFPQETPVARKQHECEMCLFPIEPGTQYVLEKGNYDGGFFTRRLHEMCSAILYDFMTESWESEFEWDWIFEWLQQRYCDGCACEDICLDSDTDWRKLAFKCPRIMRGYGRREAV